MTTAEFEGRRVVIVDDDALLRGLLATQLQNWGFVVAQATSPRTAIDQCIKLDPDGVILDVDLGDGLNGFQLAEALVRRFPHLEVVFLTRFPDARSSLERLSPALRNAAYVNKNAVENSDELLVALNAALKGHGVSVRHDERPDRPLSGLTRAQFAVLQLMYEGLTNGQIAEARGISVSAVEKNVSRIFQSLGLTGNASNARSTAVRLFAENYGHSPRSEK